jgi:hypothetical protein
MTKEWNQFINKSGKTEFEVLLAGILKDALAKVDQMSDEELETLGRS